MSHPSSTARLTHIDAAKGLAIILIVLGHSPFWVLADESKALSVIYSFHLPLFLFLSGVFLQPAQPLASIAASKAQSLLKPYFVVLLTLAVIAITLRGQHLVDRVAAILYGNGETLTWIPMWFLPYLWVVLLASSWLLQQPFFASNRIRQILLATVLAWIGATCIAAFWDVSVTLFQQTIMIRGLPFSLDLVPIACFFVLLGYAMRQPVLAAGRWSIAWGIAPILFIGWHLWIDASLDLNLRRYDHPLLSSIAAVLGIAATLSIARIAARTPFLGAILSRLGRSSLFILIFHAPIQGAVWHRLYGPLSPGFSAVLACAAGVVVPVAIYEITRRVRLLRALLLPPARQGGT